MRYLALSEVLALYRRIMQQSGGSLGIRDLGALESAVAQPRMTFGNQELYPTIVDGIDVCWNLCNAMACFRPKYGIIFPTLLFGRPDGIHLSMEQEKSPTQSQKSQGLI